MQWRSDHPDDPTSDRQRRDGERPRLNLLLTDAGGQRPSAIEQLPRLLEPMGISTIRASSGEEAVEVIRTIPVHIALVDLSIPVCSSNPQQTAGPRLLKLIRHLDPVPPTVVVRSPQASRDAARTLTQALRDGAFAVLDRPLSLEAMLEVMRRILLRHYGGTWPTGK